MTTEVRSSISDRMSFGSVYRESSCSASRISAPLDSQTLAHGYTVEGKATLLETTLDPSGGEIAHASEQSSSVALEPTHTSPIPQERSFEAASLRGIMPSFSASPSNSAAPPLASESAHSEEMRWAVGDVVATFA